MYVNYTDPKVKNFEALFSLTAPDGKSDPLPNSIFNIKTLQLLLDTS
jgi:hypothetical protein